MLLRIGIALWALLACAAAIASVDRGDAGLDLEVYAWGARHAFDDGNLYALVNAASGLRFTYTPFAALCLRGLAELGLLAPVAFAALSLLALARTSVLLARHRGRLLPQLPAPWAALAIGASVLLMGPTISTLVLGQLGLVLLWLVCEDLLVERRRAGGVLVGLATALKLTPGIYLVLLALVGRWRALLVAGATVLATIAIGFAALPVESRSFWSGTGASADRVGAIAYESNQSINGALWRALGEDGSLPAWIVLGALLGGTSLLLARHWWLAGERAGAVGLAGLAGLFVSPVSWDHHWVAVAPLVVALLGAERRRAAAIAIAVLAAATYASRVVFLVDHPVAGEAYLLAGVLLLVGAYLTRPGDRRTARRSPAP